MSGFKRLKMDPDVGIVKWACDYCTYENYPTNLKCVMCRAAKRTQYIQDAALIQSGSYSQDLGNMLNIASTVSHQEELKRKSQKESITKATGEDHSIAKVTATKANQTETKTVTTATSNTSDLCSPTGATQSQSNQKWPCKACTYLNWPNSIKCNQCLTPKGHEYSQAYFKEVEREVKDAARFGISTGGDSDRTCQESSCVEPDVATRPSSSFSDSPERVSKTGGEVDVKESSPTASQSLSLSSYRIQEPSNRSSSPTNGSLSSLLNKWPCIVCTYENWPRTQKCAMCFTPRGKKAPPASLPDDGLEANLSQMFSKNSDSKARCDNVGRSTSSLSSHSPRASSETRTNDENLRNFVISNSKASSSPLRSSRGSPGPGSPGSVSPASSGSESGAKSSRKPEISGGAVAASSTSSTTPDNKRTERESRETERRLRQARKHEVMAEIDWLFLHAFQGAHDNELDPVDAYLAAGGDKDRLLTESECTLLGRPSVFPQGSSLIQIAVRFQSEDVLALLLTSEMEAHTIKRMPSHISPDIAADILRHVSVSLRQKKGPFGCYFVSDCVTFSWPSEIVDLPITVQQKLFDEVLDKDVQNELEGGIINWSLELTTRLGSRLYALWNRTSGDCLLDSILQATYGVFDRDNTLRRALGDTLHEAGHAFFPRWREYEMRQATSLQFTLDESQLQQDWAILLSIASQPGASLEQLHIFALAHILRRPIIVYGVRYVKNFRGDNIGLARFQGIYVPFLWDQSFCWKTPVTLGYTRGHFSALVPMDMENPDANRYGAIASQLTLEDNRNDHVAYLPLVDREGKRLPLHFMTHTEMGREDLIIREWLDCRVTDSGILVAVQRLLPRPLTQRHLIDEWLNHYRNPASSSLISPSHHIQHHHSRHYQQPSTHHLHHHRTHLSSCTTPPPSDAGASTGLHLESSEDETDDE